MTKIKMFSTSVALFFTVFFFSSCKKEGITENNISPEVAKEKTSLDLSRRCLNQNVFPPQARMYGKSYTSWIKEWWKWNLKFDCAQFPLADLDGALQNQSQNRLPHVFFLSGRRGNTLNVTVPAHASVFFPCVTYYEERPAVAPGVDQSLHDAVSGVTDLMDQLSLTIDGQNVDVSSYKFVTPTFVFSANADLANCYDPDILGTQQPFVAGGYFVMLKPLSCGTHTIHRVGGASALFPFVFDITYNITQL